LIPRIYQRLGRERLVDVGSYKPVDGISSLFDLRPKHNPGNKATAIEAQRGNETDEDQTQ